MKTFNYFPHDFNARNDAKLVRLRMKMGNRGIGIYWSIIEMLYEEGGKIELSNLDAIAFAINEDLTNVQQVVQQFDLFKFDEQFFWSDSVTERLKNIKRISRARSAAGKASGAKRKKNEDDEPPQVPESETDKGVEEEGTNVQQMFNKCSTEGQQSVKAKTNNINKNKIEIEIKGNIVVIDKPKGYEDCSFDYVPLEHRSVFFEWLDFKREKGQKYKSDKSLKVCYNKLLEFSGGDVLKMKAIIEQSIASNYIGLFPLKEGYGQRNITGAERQYQAGEKAFNRVMSRINARQSGKAAINTDDLFSQPTDGDLQG